MLGCMKEDHLQEKGIEWNVRTVVQGEGEGEGLDHLV